MEPFNMNLDQQFHSLNALFDDSLKIAMRKVNRHQPEEMSYEVK